MNFGNLRSQMSDLAHSGAAKTRELAEIAKLKMNISAEQDTIRRAYTEIGKRYYAAHGTEEKNAYPSICAKITECNQKIADSKQKIADIRAAGNIPDEDAECEETEEDSEFSEETSEAGEADSQNPEEG